MVTAVTAVLLIVCGVGIGCIAFITLLVTIWARHDSWFYYIGFVGCPIMIVGGLISLKNLKAGSIVGLAGYVSMLFYVVPGIVVRTIQGIIAGNIPDARGFLMLGLLVLLLLLTVVRLILNIGREVTNGLDSQRD